jgi:hypothetical protein
MKSKIETVFSFIAVIFSITAIIIATKTYNSDINIYYLLIGAGASMVGVLISIFVKKLFTSKSKDKIYISYSDSDKSIAENIRKRLMQRHLILNIDHSNISIGDNIDKIITQEIEDSYIIIILLSKNSENSFFVKNEIKLAIKKKKKILPVIIEPNVKIPSELKNIRFADYSSNNTEAINEIVKAVEGLLLNK